MTKMRFYDGQHGFYAGIDLHARKRHLDVLDAKGQVVSAGVGHARVSGARSRAPAITQPRQTAR